MEDTKIDFVKSESALQINNCNAEKFQRQLEFILSSQNRNDIIQLNMVIS